jgi:hypothetical protein
MRRLNPFTKALSTVLKTQISCLESTLVTASGPHDFLDLLCFSFGQ